MRRAIDVSRWQGPISWGAVRQAGVDAAWIKVGGADGPRLYRDAQGDANRAGARAAGVPFGTYYFCNPAGDPVAQAQHAVATCHHGDGDLWPMADLETNPTHKSHEELDEWLSCFCHEVMCLLDTESIWYGGHNTGVGFTDKAPKGCGVWIANYGMNRPGSAPPRLTDQRTSKDGEPIVPPKFGTWDIWQFNSVTEVPGIAGHVDQNVIKDAFWDRMTGPMPEEEDDEMVRLKVIMWSKEGSAWARDVAGFAPGQEAAAWLAYDAGGVIKHIRTPDELNALHYVGVPDLGFVDDWALAAFKLVGLGGVSNDPHDG